MVSLFHQLLSLRFDVLIIAAADAPILLVLLAGAGYSHHNVLHVGVFIFGCRRVCVSTDFTLNVVPLTARLPGALDPLFVVLARVRADLVAKITKRTLFQGLVTGRTKFQRHLVDLNFGKCANLTAVATLILLGNNVL